jgi:hypothetical protein
MARLRGQLAVDESCSAEELLVAASNRLGELEADLRKQHAERRVAEAMHSGRISSAEREWAVQLCLRDERLFDEWLECCPVVVVPGRMAVGQSRQVSEHAAVAQARAEFRAHPELACLTSEDAYVADAKRGVEFGT